MTLAYGPFEFYWGLLVAYYPFISGLVAGTFIISTLSYVFRKEIFRPVMKLSLIMSVVLLVVAALPLVADLGNPAKAYSIFTRAHFSSPMSAFGIVFILFLLVAFSLGYVIFRADNIRTASQKTGLKKSWYSALSLGSTDLSEGSISRDASVARALGIVGIGLATAFTAYAGFVFGSINARALWATPLMPVIFVLSALVSGTALVIMVHAIMERFFSSYKKLNRPLLVGLGGMLAWFLLLDFGLQSLEILTRAYAGAEEVFAMSFLLYGPVAWAFIGVQIIGALVIPLLILTVARRSIPGIAIASILALIGVLTMRINFIVGGQLIPRSGQEFIPLSATHHHFLAELPPTIGIGAMALLLFGLAVWTLPWEPSQATSGGKR